MFSTGRQPNGGQHNQYQQRNKKNRCTLSPPHQQGDNPLQKEKILEKYKKELLWLSFDCLLYNVHTLEFFVQKSELTYKELKDFVKRSQHIHHRFNTQCSEVYDFEFRDLNLKKHPFSLCIKRQLMLYKYFF